MPTKSGLHNAVDVRASQLGEYIYCWNGRNRMLKYNGVVWRYAGIDKAVFTPSVTPAPPAGAGLTGTYYYFVVPVNSTHLDLFGRACVGLPSAMSAAATPVAQKVTVANIPATHVDAQVDKWYIFRNLNGIFSTGISDEENEFYKVGEVAIGIDTLRIAQLILRTGMYFAPMRVFFPVAVVFGLAFLVSLGLDVFVRRDMTEATLVLLVASTQLAMFALLADMIDKRSR